MAATKLQEKEREIRKMGGVPKRVHDKMKERMQDRIYELEDKIDDPYMEWKTIEQQVENFCDDILTGDIERNDAQRWRQVFSEAKRSIKRAMNIHWPKYPSTL